MSFHRACCCCPPVLYVTFAAIGSPCDCYESGGQSQKWTDLSGVNGTFEATFFEEYLDETSGYEICDYRAGYGDLGTSVIWRRFTDTECVNEFSALTFTNSIIIIELYKATGKIMRVRFGTGGTGNQLFFSHGDPYTSIPAATGGRGAIVAYPGADLNTALSNGNICGDQLTLLGNEFPVADTGTATVSLT